MEDHGDRKISKEQEEATVKPARSFRYEDYSTRRVFLRSYPLQWDWPPDEKQQQDPPPSGPAGNHRPAYGSDGDDDDERCGAGSSGGWGRQVVEWGEEKLLLLRRVRRRLALYLLGCHHGRRRPALPFRSAGGSATAAMLASR